MCVTVVNVWDQGLLSMCMSMKVRPTVRYQTNSPLSQAFADELQNSFTRFETLIKRDGVYMRWLAAPTTLVRSHARWPSRANVALARS